MSSEREFTANTPNAHIKTLERHLEDADKKIEELTKLLNGLAQRHDWSPDLGQCVCRYHVEWRESRDESGRTG